MFIVIVTGCWSLKAIGRGEKVERPVWASQNSEHGVVNFLAESDKQLF
jgi:hypothetical protein